MEILYIPSVDTPLISITAPEIEAFVDNIGDYSGITITASLTCPITPITQLYDTTEIFDAEESKYYIDEDTSILYVKPQLFGGATKFVDGIYKFDIKLSTGDGYTLISNCIFVDITLKCKVSALMQNIIKENEIKTNENVSTIIHLLHYSLVNGSNCGCNCQEMCDNFNGLKDLLLGLDPQILNDCGC